MNRRLITVLTAAVLILALTSLGQSPPKHGEGKGNRHRHGQASGQSHGRHNASMEADREIFHYLLDNREKIERTVTMLDDGVETLTESDDSEVVARIREHVASMEKRISEGKPIHMRDPLFSEIFRNADKIEMAVEDSDKGVRVRETSDDDYVAKLIQAHAEVIDKFLENGRAEVRMNHEVPTP